MNTNDTSLKPPGYWFGVIEHGLREKMREAFTELDLSRGEWRMLHTIADGPKSVDEIEAALPPGERHRRRGAGFGRGFGPGNWPGYGPGHGRWFGRFGRGFAPGFAPGFAHGPESEAGSPDARAGHAGQNEHHEHHGPDAFAHHPGNHGRPGHHEEAGHTHPGHEGEHGDRRQRRGPRSVAEVLVSFTERGWVVLADGVATLTDAGRAAHDEAQSRVTQLRASVAEGISEADYQTTMASLEKMARNVGWGEPAQDES